MKTVLYWDGFFIFEKSITLNFSFMNDHPIGIFDSGVGGTSIWRELNSLLPAENMIYLADSRNAPYGEKSKGDIISLSRKNTEWLLSKNCKLIVVACNTATTNAIDTLRASFDVPFIGIEPAIKPAAIQSDSKKVGVLATKGTLASDLFLSTSKTHASEIEVLEQEGEGLVRLIEAGEIDSNKIRNLLHQYLDPMIDEDIDHLVLGCTHYPYLIPVLKEILPADVVIIDCGEAVARQAQRIMLQRDLQTGSTNEGWNEFYINADPAILKRFLDDSPANTSISYLDF